MADDKGLVPLSHLLRALKNSGLWLSDPRLAESMKQIKKYVEGKPEFDTHRDVLLTKEMFRECTRNNFMLIRRAIGGDFVIPAFSSFCDIVDDIYWSCRTHSEGKVCKVSDKINVYSQCG